jgi:hypothetical protein
MKTTKSVKRRRTTVRRKRGGGFCENNDEICDFANSVSMHANGDSHETIDCGRSGIAKVNPIKVSQDIARLKKNFKFYVPETQTAVTELLNEYEQKYKSCIEPNSSRTSVSDLTLTPRSNLTTPGSEQSTPPTTSRSEDSSVSSTSSDNSASNSSKSSVILPLSVILPSSDNSASNSSKSSVSSALPNGNSTTDTKALGTAPTTGTQASNQPTSASNQPTSASNQPTSAKTAKQAIEGQLKIVEDARKQKEAEEKAKVEQPENNLFIKKICEKLPNPYSITKVQNNDEMPDSNVKAQSNIVVYFKDGKIYTDIKNLIDELTPESLRNISLDGTKTTITKAKVSEELYKRIQGLCPQKIDFFEKATTGGRRKRTTKRR